MDVDTEVKSRRVPTRSQRQDLIFKIAKAAEQFPDELREAVRALNSERLGLVELKALSLLVNRMEL